MRVPPGLSRAACVIVSSWAIVAAPGLQAAPPEEEADVVLRVAPASGEPGEEVAIEFRGTSRVSLNDISVHFDLAKDAGEFVRTSVEGTAASHVVPRGVASTRRMPTTAGT